jgi:hypothetical protein
MGYFLFLFLVLHCFVRCSATCAPGTASLANSTCARCPAGHFQNTSTNAGICWPCAAGTYSFRSASVCKQCAANHFLAGTGHSICQACSSGTFSNTTGATVCKTCLPGTGSLNSLNTCAECPIGTYGATGLCVACTGEHNYTDQTKQSRCKACPFAVTQFAQTPHPCVNRVGFSVHKTNTLSDCFSVCVRSNCAGLTFEALPQHCTVFARGSCTPDPRKRLGAHYKYIPGGNSNCTQHGTGYCEPGHFKNANQHCTVCPSNTIARPNMTRCVECALHYKANVGQDECVHVPIVPNTNCPVGQYSSSAGLCAPCIPGGSCTGGVILSPCADCEVGLLGLQLQRSSSICSSPCSFHAGNLSSAFGIVWRVLWSVYMLCLLFVRPVSTKGQFQPLSQKSTRARV